jgi:hypothetical protein
MMQGMVIDMEEARLQTLMELLAVSFIKATRTG